MGAIVAILGPRSKVDLAAGLGRMIARAPYRGRAEVHAEDGIAIGAQSLGWDASLAVHDEWLAAMHGYVGNWNDLGVSSDRIRQATTDADRLLVGFLELRDALFARLRGEVAGILVHRTRKQAWAFRDVLGCRPMFFREVDDCLYLASEIAQALAADGAKAVPFLEPLVAFLANREEPREETLYRGVSRLLPARVQEIDFGGRARRTSLRPYWTPPGEEETHYPIDEAGLARELRGHLARAAAYGVPKGQPFAVALSGGLDSTALWALITQSARAGDMDAARGRPVSLVYPGLACDERPLIELMASSTGASPVFVDVSRIRCDQEIERLVERLGVAMPSPMYQLGPMLSAAREDGRRVLLTGQGADEWLGVKRGFLARRLARADLRGFVRDWKHSGRAWPPSWSPFLRRQLVWAATGWLRAVPGLAQVERLRRIPRWLSPTAARGLVARPPTPSELCTDPPRRETLCLVEWYQSGLFLEPSELFAAHEGVELRHPFLSLDLIDFAFRTPAAAFSGRARTKHLQRLATSDLLPAAILEKAKVYFESAMVSGVRALAENPGRLFCAVRDADIVLRETVLKVCDRAKSGDSTDADETALLNLLIAERALRQFKRNGESDD